MFSDPIFTQCLTKIHTILKNIFSIYSLAKKKKMISICGLSYVLEYKNTSYSDIGIPGAKEVKSPFCKDQYWYWYICDIVFGDAWDVMVVS